MIEDDLDIRPKKVDSTKAEAGVDNLLGVRDKIRLVEDARRNPPKTGEMETKIDEGVYAVDLNTLLAAQLSDCPATVIPMLIDHGIRNAVDIKDTYRTEKRHMDFRYWWVIILLIGGLGFLWFFTQIIMR